MLLQSDVINLQTKVPRLQLVYSHSRSAPSPVRKLRLLLTFTKLHHEFSMRVLVDFFWLFYE